jgi:hypothetical protein
MKRSLSKSKPFRSSGYLKLVRGEPCLACGSPLDVQAHHLRHAERRGIARKASDKWAVPLCVKCHMNCHTVGAEADWWLSVPRKDPVGWAVKFFSSSKYSESNDE